MKPRIIIVDISTKSVNGESSVKNTQENNGRDNFRSTIEKISANSGRVPTSCTCNHCKEQCKTPCLGTPADILKLINAGYIEKLDLTLWVQGYVLKKCPLIPMVQAIRTKDGCVFLKNGLCELHDLGLKPTQGILSHHTLMEENFIFERSLGYNVAKEWVKIQNLPVIVEILEAFSNYHK